MSPIVLDSIMPLFRVLGYSDSQSSSYHMVGHFVVRPHPEGSRLIQRLAFHLSGAWKWFGLPQMCSLASFCFTLPLRSNTSPCRILRSYALRLNQLYHHTYRSLTFQKPMRANYLQGDMCFYQERVALSPLLKYVFNFYDSQHQLHGILTPQFSLGHTYHNTITGFLVIILKSLLLYVCPSSISALHSSHSIQIPPLFLFLVNVRVDLKRDAS